jgi:hypothetical protein
MPRSVVRTSAFERRRAEAVTDLEVRALALVFAGRHRLVGDEEVVRRDGPDNPTS